MGESQIRKRISARTHWGLCQIHSSLDLHKTSGMTQEQHVLDLSALSQAAGSVVRRCAASRGCCTLLAVEEQPMPAYAKAVQSHHYPAVSLQCPTPRLEERVCVPAFSLASLPQRRN